MHKLHKICSYQNIPKHKHSSHQSDLKTEMCQLYSAHIWPNLESKIYDMNINTRKPHNSLDVNALFDKFLKTFWYT